MKNTKNNKVSKFLGKEVENEEIVLSSKDGIVERVDKKLVTKDGKQLLKEQLYEA